MPATVPSELEQAAIRAYGLLWRDLYWAPSPYAQRARAALRGVLTREQRKAAITEAIREFGSPTDSEVADFVQAYDVKEKGKANGTR